MTFAPQSALPGPPVIVWSAGVGDPTLLGWATTMLYFVASWCALRAVRRAPASTGAERSFFRLLALVLVLLGFNKQLDLQTLLLHSAKRALWQNGLYSQRAALALVLLLLAVGVGALSSWWLARGLRRAPRATWLAGAGAAGLGVFVILRAASFSGLGGLGGALLGALLALVCLGAIASGGLSRARGRPER